MSANVTKCSIWGIERRRLGGEQEIGIFQTGGDLASVCSGRCGADDAESGAIGLVVDPADAILPQRGSDLGGGNLKFPDGVLCAFGQRLRRALKQDETMLEDDEI